MALPQQAKDTRRPTWVHRPAATGPRLVHVSVSAGGVAEQLRGLVPAQAATGLAAGWAVIGEDQPFSAFGAYLHHLLHGRANALTSQQLEAATPMYRAALAPQAAWLIERLAPGDVVVLHDPQTLGMAPPLAMAGLRVVWHCHIGTTDDASGPAAAWQNFAPELSSVDAVLTTLPEFAPQLVPPARRHIVAPAVDPHSAKNRALTRSEVAALLGGIGLTAGHPGGSGQVEQDQPLPAHAPTVLQVARWSPLKDMPGVLRCVAALPPEVHVVLAGDDPDQTPGDPDGAKVLREVRALRARLSPADRARVHLVLLSGQTDEQAALVVNALQRRADVVLQKSLAEGFGLTVTEAMIKGRAVVAANVGGLGLQISPGHSGLLANPRDTEAVAAALRCLLEDEPLRRRLGRGAAESASRRYVMPRLVADYQQFVAPVPIMGAREVA